MGRQNNFLGIIGIVLVLAIFGALQFIAPTRGSRFGSKHSLADLADMYQSDAQAAPPSENEQAGNQVGNTFQYARASLSSQSTEESRGKLERLTQAEHEILGQIPDEAGEISNVKNDATDLQSLQLAKRTLETQQDFLLKQIVKLRKQLEEERGRVWSEDPSALQTKVAEQAQALEKDKNNIQILADNILQLRKEIKSKDEQLERLTAALESGRDQLENLQKSHTGRNEKSTDENLARLAGEKGDLELQLAKAKQQQLELEDELARERSKLQALEGEKTSDSGVVQKFEKDLASKDEEILELKRQLSKTIEDAKESAQDAEEKGKKITDYVELTKTVETLKAQLQSKTEENKTLEERLKDSEQVASTIPSLKKELFAAKNQLMLHETEMEQSPKKGGKSAGTAQLNPETLDRHMEESGRVAGTETIRGKSSVGDATIVQIRADRVALRTGPSPEDSEVMSVSRGHCLTVEQKQGDWFGVLAPNSSRAWVRADMVKVVPQSACNTRAELGFGSEEEGEQKASLRSSSTRAPRKQPLKTISPDGDVEPFGDVKEKDARGDSAVLRQFQQLRSRANNAPVDPEMIPPQ